MFISIAQALSIWSDLERAYHGTNSYGGDTAEIYIHRLMPYMAVASLTHPAMLIDSDCPSGEMAREAYDQANEALHDVLAHFIDTHRKDFRITIDGREFGEWLKTARNTHRVHVQILRENEKERDPEYLATLDGPMPVGNLRALLSKKLDKRSLDPCTPVTFQIDKDGKIDAYAVERE